MPEIPGRPKFVDVEPVRVDTFDSMQTADSPDAEYVRVETFESMRHAAEAEQNTRQANRPKASEKKEGA